METSAPVSPSNAESSRILCVWFPEWPIQRQVVARPELRQQPVVLFWQHPQRGQLVAAVSPRAQRDGVRHHMPLSEAKSLLQAGSNQPTTIELHQPEIDRVQLIQLALGCEHFSPHIGLEQESQPTCIFLDISGLGHLFGSENSLVQQVQRHFQASGYHPQLAVAPTIGMAWARSRYPECRLEDLPIEALRLTESTLDALRQLGIEQVGQLLQLPRAAIKTRLGDTILQRLDQLTGQRREVLNTLHRAAERSATRFLDYPVSHLATIEVLIERLVAQLCRELHAQQRGAIQWHFELSGPESLPLRVTVNLFQPSATSEHVMQIFQMQMEGVLRQPPPTRGSRSQKHTGQSAGQHKKSAGQHRKSAGQHRGQHRQVHLGGSLVIQEITVSVLRSVLLTERQRELFDENPRLNRQAFAQLVNRLASHLGSQQVLQPRLLAGAQAEFATRLVPLVGPGADCEDTANPVEQTRKLTSKLARRSRHSHRSSRRARAGDAQPTFQPRPPLNNRPFAMDRPLRLYEQPMQLQAVSISDGRPALLIGQQQHLRVTRAWGPERIESGWWRGPTVRRDYWRTETECGRWLWVYRNLQDRQWYLHGEF